ncbi:cell division protein CdvB1/B2 [Sulfuracidifex metallicus]|uniref:cell division protein CdvB1/B2 n=1 Tax=Sulfuracidifex metallicus TaxID=47303 RepID=UPI002275C1A3|nr:cell division protein CdvB1/B2 [Sulfuracidifex metallicus]MCY0850674.1 cell division protein CdvB1/B2 [Sulfuracidifex metallicus]
MFGKDFQKIWGDTDSSFSGKNYKLKEPLKYALIHSQYKLSAMISRLDAHISRMQERDKALFERVIEAQMSKDTARAAMYANEVAEIRKATKQLLVTQIALEQVKLRMETVSEIGDVFVNLMPVVGVVNQLRTSLKGVMPEISLELSELGDGLQEVVMESGEFMGGSSYGAAESPEARKILEEATAVAEQKMKEQFPDLPSSGLPLAARQKA